MDFAEIYHVLFETYTGIAILVGAGLVLSILVSIIFEIKTRKIYRNHEKTSEEDEWALFEEDVERGFAQEVAEEEAEEDK